MRQNKRMNFHRLLVLYLGTILLIGSTAVFAAEPSKEAAAPAQQTQTTCAEGENILEWTALPWPLVGGDGAIINPQVFTNVNGSDIDVTFDWVNTYQQPYLYAGTAPIAEMSDDVRVPNSDTSGSLAQFNITFDPPVYLNQFTVGSLSVLNDTRTEYVFLSAFDDASNLQAATGLSTSTYVVEGGTLQTIQVPGNTIVSPLNNVYRLQGASDQPPGFLPGYDRATLSFEDTPIERIELVVFGSNSTDPDTALDNINLAPISTTLEAFCFTDPGTLDIALQSTGTTIEQSSKIVLILAATLLLIASAYVWEKRQSAV